MKCDKAPIYKRVYRVVFSRRPKVPQAPKDTDTLVSTEPVRGSPEDLQSLVPTIDRFQATQENMLATAVRDTLEQCGSRLRGGYKETTIEIASPVVVYPVFKTQYKERVTAVLIAQGYKIDGFEVELKYNIDYSGKKPGEYTARVKFHVNEPLLLK